MRGDGGLGREPIKSVVVGGVRFGAHNGLKSDVAPCPKVPKADFAHVPAKSDHSPMAAPAATSERLFGLDAKHRYFRRGLF